MARTLSAILDEALSLSQKQRAEIARRLILSLDGPAPDAEEQKRIDGAWAAEIKRRSKQVEDGSAELIPGEDVFSRLEGSLKARKRS